MVHFDFPHKAFNLDVTNQSGSLIYSMNIKANEKYIRLDLSQFIGTYYLRLSNNESVFTHKIIIAP